MINHKDFCVPLLGEMHKKAANIVMVNLLNEHDFMLCNNSTLVGGAPRDTLLGNPINDLDVFTINPTMMAGIKNVKEVHDSSGFGWTDISKLAKDHNGRSIGSMTQKGMKIDIKCLNEDTGSLWKSDVLNEFYMGICQVGWSPEAGWQWTEAFERDVKDKTLTIGLSINWDGFNTRHLRKMQRKFPDYKVIDKR